METLRYLALLAVFFLLAVAIIFIGWDEPLRYRFMSPVAIAAEESVLRPAAPVPTSSSEVQFPRGTALDRAPWARDRRGRVKYGPAFDSRTMGTPTETRERENLYGPGGALGAPPGGAR